MPNLKEEDIDAIFVEHTKLLLKAINIVIEGRVLLARRKWEPIETAPMDGTVILGYALGEMTTVYWIPNNQYWTLNRAGAFAEDGEWWPTHWQPLPEPPNSINKQK